VLALPTPATAALAPGLFGGHPPAGRVAADNTLTLPRRRKPRGYILLIHGGGWIYTGSQTLDAERTNVRWFTSLGWAVYDVDYRPGRLSVVDVVAAYDQLRRRHPAAVTCAYGQSAGGTLAMLLAASRPSLRCIVSAGGITDLASIPASGPLHRAIEKMFHGAEWEFSPVRLARYIHGTLLCAGSSFDQVVPERAQLAEIKRARPQTTAMLLTGAATPGGPSFIHPPNFVHASITHTAMVRFRRAVERLLGHALSPKAPM
jgi:acetyl esterase/lipase